jgi:hypothetical protein
MDELKSGVIVVMKNGTIRRYPSREWHSINHDGLEFSWAFATPAALRDHLAQYRYDNDGAESPELEGDDMDDW